jgi:hypothetical protein
VSNIYLVPIPVAARSEVWVCGSSLAAITCSNPPGGHEGLSVLTLERFQVKVSASGRSLIQRSPTVCGVIAKPRKGRP